MNESLYWDSHQSCLHIGTSICTVPMTDEVVTVYIIYRYIIHILGYDRYWDIKHVYYRKTKTASVLIMWYARVYQDRCKWQRHAGSWGWIYQLTSSRIKPSVTDCVLTKHGAYNVPHRLLISLCGPGNLTKNIIRYFFNKTWWILLL